MSCAARRLCGGNHRSEVARHRISTLAAGVVEHERCDACGFDGSSYDGDSLVAAARGLGPRWRVLLDDAANDLRVRPGPGVWSAIEYAAHSRDITALHVFGVEQALTQDEPVYPAIEADDLITVSAASYANDDPKAVVDALDSHACGLARLADEADAVGWERGLTIGFVRSSVRRLVEHALHDSVHHLDDVERGLQSLRA